MTTLKTKKPLILCILDGWGHREETSHNVLAAAHLPTWNRLKQNYPYTILEASAHHVGLPEGQMGNSEVGHMNIGAGRIIRQDLPRIDHALATGTFKKLPLFQEYVTKLLSSGGRCHLMGLLSDGGVHSHQNHIIQIAQALAEKGLEVLLHIFLDGRDTPPCSGKGFVQNLLEKIKSYPSIRLASFGGRYYGMDRDQRWDRVDKAYRAIAFGDAPRFNSSLETIDQWYQQEITDEFIVPHVSSFYQGIQEGDGLLHLNFRADRVRQLLSAFIDPHFKAFDRGSLPSFAAVAGMAEYSEILTPYCPAFFPPEKIQDTLGEVISRSNLTQLRAAETEKYAHVTFFFNGGREDPFPGEDRLLVPSPSVATYDLQPEMSAYTLTDQLIQAYHDHSYDVIIVNYANADMVGHSGQYEAALKAVEAIDRCLTRLCQFIDDQGGYLLITADHGNVEQIFDTTSQQPHTAHTLNPVPFVLYGSANTLPKLQSEGQLCDIAPTLLALLNIPQPLGMTGENLIKSA